MLITVLEDIEDLRFEFLDQVVQAASFASGEFENRVRAAGLEVTSTRSEVFEPGKPGAEPEEHFLVTARKP
ncbi:hypothetical protein QRX50_41295 [Amycolatopsis carbonis]|uniref:Uncharacterized protein n=1 Tax=Amycolatopsis carbonis TaxID=715471 RepID=A0A9Y2MWG3_9PSEU|nr:hypothetical protein [Amycolatopsis sp. 2-15]WIX77772.1 hypothetical protein QRX50_41295 [Amycolatopsis sp. 2-15]